MTFTLKGKNFRGIETPFYGKISTDNDNPEEHRYESSNNFLFNVEVVSNEELRLTHRTSATFPNGSYLGVLANANGSEVYWVNNTKPLQ